MRINAKPRGLSRKLMQIPKTIIQTARSYEALPAEIKQNIADLKSRNPDWTYRFFDDDQLKPYLKNNIEP